MDSLRESERDREKVEIDIIMTETGREIERLRGMEKE